VENIDVHSPMTAVGSAKLSKQFLVRYTPKAQQRITSPAASVSERKFDSAGISKGSALAAGLAQFGLGFRPKVNPRSGYILEIDVGDEDDNLYPIGWKNTAPLFHLVPIGNTIEVDLPEENAAALDDVIALVGEKLKVPHLYSSYQLLKRKKNISAIPYSRKPQKLAIERFMNILGTSHQIGLSLRTDEAGKVFLWITSSSDYESFRKRFAHVKIEVP